MTAASPTIWRHHPGYAEAVSKVRGQSLAEDLAMIDNLFGRGGLAYGATPEQVKAETLRQVEIDWRSHRDDRAEFWTAVGAAQRGGRR